MQYIVNHIPKSTPHNRRPGIVMTPETLTIHSTGNLDSSAANERGWLINPKNNRQASWHIVVDDKEAIEAIPLREIAWHAGDGGGPGNWKSIGVEICESGNRAKTLQNAVELVAELLKQRKWGVDKLRRHFDWSGKTCPGIMAENNWAGWEKFKVDLDRKLTTPDQALPKIDRRVEGTTNGKPVTLDAYLINGLTYVPLRIIGEALGAKVWGDGRKYSIDK